jgi:hypothetical protein
MVACALLELKNLEKLVFSVPCHHMMGTSREYEAGFREVCNPPYSLNPHMFESIKRLAVGERCEFILQHCPKVEHVATYNYDYGMSSWDQSNQLELFQAVQRAPALLAFEMFNEHTIPAMQSKPFPLLSQLGCRFLGSRANF